MKIVMCSSKFGKEKPGLGRVQFGRIWPFGPGFDSYRRLAINYTHISVPIIPSKLLGQARGILAG